MKIILACEKCGKQPEKDEKLSNENWNVVSTKCECGGKIKTQILK